jgi:hypothetical protein
MGPTTAAKRAGLEWSDLTTEERKIVAEVSRVVTKHFQNEQSKLAGDFYKICSENVRLRERLKTRINKIINKKARKRA